MFSSLGGLVKTISDLKGHLGPVAPDVFRGLEKLRPSMSGASNFGPNGGLRPGP